MAAVVAALNAVLPPLLAALRLPFMLALGFVLVLLLNAFVLKLASDVLENTFSSTTSAGRCWRRSSSLPSAWSSR